MLKIALLPVDAWIPDTIVQSLHKVLDLASNFQRKYFAWTCGFKKTWFNWVGCFKEKNENYLTVNTKFVYRCCGLKELVHDCIEPSYYMYVNTRMPYSAKRNYSGKEYNTTQLFSFQSLIL